MRALVVLLLALASACAESTAVVDGEREAVVAVLAGRELDLEAPPEAVRDEGAAAVLVALARDPGEHPRYVQHRAVALLRYHPRPEVYDALLEFSASDDGGMREAALQSLGRAFVKRHARELAALAGDRLADPDDGVRRAARELLVRARTARFQD